MVVEAVGVPFHQDQRRVVVHVRRVDGVLRHDGRVVRPLDEQDRAVIVPDGRVDIELAIREDIPLGDPLLVEVKAVRDFVVGELFRQPRDHQCGGQRDQFLIGIRMVPGRHDRREAALGVAAEVQLRDEIQRLRIVGGRIDVVEPLRKVVVFEGTVALPVAVQFHTERCDAEVVHRRSDRTDVSLLHMPGQAVKHDAQRALLEALRPVQLRVEPDAVVVQV